MKKNPKLEARRKKIPNDVKIFIDKSFATTEQIDIILKKRGLTQRNLAELLNKSESEISKWMSGSHNFTFQTIAKIESVLGESISICPKDVKVEYNILIFSPDQSTIVQAKVNRENKMDTISKQEANNLALFRQAENIESINTDICLHHLN
jgi:transcriptional regulator with XRE-family HTH domain